MKRAGFKWFVAWRYLMARPRRLSPALFLVAGLSLVTSTGASLLAEVFRPPGTRSFISLGAAELFAGCGLILGLWGAIALVAGLFRFCRSQLEGSSVPALALASFMTLGVGVLARSAEDAATSRVGLGLMALSAPLLLASLVLYLRAAGRRAWGVLASSALLLAAGGLTSLCAHALLAIDAVPPAEAALLIALALWAVAAAVAGVAAVRQRAVQRPSRVGLVAALLLLIGAGYTWSASGASEPLEPALAPPADTLFELVVDIGAIAPIVAAAGGALALVCLLVWFRRRSEHATAPAPRLLAPLSVGLGLLGGCTWLASLVFTSGFEPFLVLSARQFSEQQVLLAATVLLALGQLILLLAAMRYFFTFFTTVSVAGVTIGSMALVIVLSVMSGFEIDLRNKILGSNAHILITKEGDEPFTEYRELVERVLAVPGVVAQMPYLTSEVVIAANSNYANVIIKGVDPETVGTVTELGKNTRQPDAIARLYPLAEDGSVIGRPAENSDGGGETPDAGAGAETAGQGSEFDPPPDDMELDWDVPTDFSGGGDGDGGSDGADSDELPSGADEASAMLDRPPADMELDWDEPMDFSGSPSEDEPGGVAGEAADDPLAFDDEVTAEPGMAPGEIDTADDLPFGRRERALELGDSFAEELGREIVARAANEQEREALDDELDVDEAIAPAKKRVRISPRVARLPGVIVGKELVKNLHLYAGQEVRIISPLAEDTPAGPVPRTRYLRVAGTFFTGMYEYDFKYVYVPLDTLQLFLDMAEQVEGIEIRVEEPAETDLVVRELRAALPETFRVQDWKEINRNLFSALKLEKIAMFLVLAIIILVASFSIISNLIMVVVEKAKEIALLKTLGAADLSVVGIFIAQGFFIGFIGTIAGVGHGLLACYLGNVYGLPLDPEVYYIDRLPIHVEFIAVTAVTIAGIVISVLATLYPAMMAARLRPMEGLRYD